MTMADEKDKRLKKFSLKAKLLSLKRWVLQKHLQSFLLNNLLTILWVMKIYIVWVKVYKIPAISASHESSCELAKSQDYLQNTPTHQLLACAPHVIFAGYTTSEPSCKINFLSKSSSLKSKPITIKSHKIQGNKLIKLQHFLSWNKTNINLM